MLKPIILDILNERKQIKISFTYFFLLKKKTWLLETLKWLAFNFYQPACSKSVSVGQQHTLYGQ